MKSIVKKNKLKETKQPAQCCAKNTKNAVGCHD